MAIIAVNMITLSVCRHHPFHIRQLLFPLAGSSTGTQRVANSSSPTLLRTLRGGRTPVPTLTSSARLEPRKFALITTSNHCINTWTYDIIPTTITTITTSGLLSLLPSLLSSLLPSLLSSLHQRESNPFTNNIRRTSVEGRKTREKREKQIKKWEGVRRKRKHERRRNVKDDTRKVREKTRTERKKKRRVEKRGHVISSLHYHSIVTLQSLHNHFIVFFILYYPL